MSRPKIRFSSFVRHRTTADLPRISTAVSCTNFDVIAWYNRIESSSLYSSQNIRHFSNLGSFNYKKGPVDLNFNTEEVYI